MNLYLFPQAPVTTNGYGIAVLSDTKRLSIKDDDVVVWYTNNKSFCPRENDIIIPRPKLFSKKNLVNTLRSRFHCEIMENELKFLDGKLIDEIFVGDIALYRAVRLRYPNKKITVRFHNVFSRIKTRCSVLKIKTHNLKYNLTIKSLIELEHMIFRDENVHKIFISEEDKLYYVQITGKNDDSEVWPFIPDCTKAYNNRGSISMNNKLVWFGGADGHKCDSIIWLIKYVIPLVKLNIPNIEFHLFGAGTERFNHPANNIYGHGRYSGDDYPFNNCALYVNPDLMGGGVKIKVMEYFEHGIPFISTPFGFEGYPKDLIDNKFCYVVDPQNWANKIVEILRNNQPSI